MRERPILFSAPMVRALLAGTKTVTRRIVKPSVAEIADVGLVGNRLCPYGVAGDQLWVKETHARFSVGEGMNRPVPECVAYRASCEGDGFDYVNTRGEIMALTVTKWTPSIFMPRWASRITLDVVSVRVERLHEIDDEDARREGVEPQVTTGKVYPSKHAADVERRSYRGGFEDLWGEINGEDSWDTNPWVWRIEVKRVPAPLTLADVKDALAAGAEVRCAAERTKKRSPRR